MSQLYLEFSSPSIFTMHFPGAFLGIMDCHKLLQGIIWSLRSRFLEYYLVPTRALFTLVLKSIT